MRTRLFSLGILFSLLLSVKLPAYAQQQQEAKLQLMARPQKDKILLRWAVDNPLAWKQLNTYGYKLVRYTVMKDNLVLSKPFRKTIGEAVIKPLPLEEWETLAQQSDYAAVLAQAIYGDDFEVSSGGAAGVAQIVAQSEELNQRHAFALYAADQNFEAARYAALGIVDHEARPHEKYLYRLIPQVPPGKGFIDSTSVFVGLEDYEELPKPDAVTAKFGDKTVMLTWDSGLLQRYYNSYFVERSLDGGASYQSLSDLPVTSLGEKEGEAPGRMYLIDSLQDNSTTYYYRIKGISPFGEIGPSSEAVSGKGKSLLSFVPHLTGSSMDGQGVLELEWEFPKEASNLIRGFQLNQAEAAAGPYRTVSNAIPPTARKFSLKEYSASNYFTITALALEGESRTSFPLLVQPLDSIPPAVPAGLSASVDSTGVVTLSWQSNTEADLFGYKVFRAASPTHEPIPVIDSVQTAALFSDKVPLNSLNNKLYYAVTALDTRYNQSAFSTMLEVTLPDIIPPNMPVLTSYKVENGTVKLSWAPGSDRDLAAYQVYRRQNGQEAWQSLRSLAKGKTSFVDEEVEEGKSYQYYLAARDESGLLSEPSRVLDLKIPPGINVQEIKDLTAYVDRNKRYIQLFWSDNLPNVAEYQLYKAADDAPPTLWKYVQAGQKQVVDETLQANTQYRYLVRARLKSGGLSKMKEIKVTY